MCESSTASTSPPAATTVTEHEPESSEKASEQAEPDLSLEMVQGLGADGNYMLRTASGRYLKMPPSAYHLLVNRSRGASFEDIAAAMNHKKGSSDVTPEKVRQAHRHVVAKLRKIEEQDSLTRSGFWLRLPLISEEVVNRLTPFFGVFFRKWAAVALLGLIVVAGLVFPRLFVSLQFDNQSLIWGYVLMLGSLILHELGHASACAYFGARPRAIGFGVYLIYPVFYSDVSSAWELERWQRVVVDLAGLFFQGAVGALYVLLYVWLDWEPLLAGILMIAGSGAFSLNPIFKFDGYWMIADALGVHNLSRQPTRVVGHYWARLRGARAEPLPWKPWVTRVLSVYSVLSFSVWGLFIWFVVPFFAARIWAYPGQVIDFLGSLRGGDSSHTMAFAVSTYMFLLAAVIIGRMLQGWLPGLWRLLTQSFKKVTTLVKQPEPAS